MCRQLKVDLQKIQQNTGSWESIESSLLAPTAYLGHPRTPQMVRDASKLYLASFTSFVSLEGEVPSVDAAEHYLEDEDVRDLMDIQ